jgi:hypothetical protein
VRNTGRNLREICPASVGSPLDPRSYPGALTMLETHIMMSSLVFCFALTLTLLLVSCLGSLMDLTIAHMVLVHKRTTLCLDTLVTAHVLIVEIISHVGLVSLLEGLTHTLS